MARLNSRPGSLLGLQDTVAERQQTKNKRDIGFMLQAGWSRASSKPWESRAIPFPGLCNHYLSVQVSPSSPAPQTRPGKRGQMPSCTFGPAKDLQLLPCTAPVAAPPSRLLGCQVTQREITKKTLPNAKIWGRPRVYVLSGVDFLVTVGFGAPEHSQDTRGRTEVPCTAQEIPAAIRWSGPGIANSSGPFCTLHIKR